MGFAGAHISLLLEKQLQSKRLKKAISQSPSVSTGSWLNIEELDDRFARSRRLVHQTARIGRKRVVVMHGAPVVPDQKIADPPLVLPDVFVLARVRPDCVEQLLALFERQPEDVRVEAAPKVQAFAARDRVSPHD